MGGEKVPRETWEAWQAPLAPEPHLLTRAEMLALVERVVPKKTDENDLRYWEKIGVLPHPVRKWHNGATRALYPSWMVTLIFQLRLYQEIGYRLEELPSRLRVAAQRLSFLPPEQRLPGTGLPLPEEWAAGMPIEGDNVIITDLALYDTIRVALITVAIGMRTRLGIPIVRANIVLIDAEGREYPIPIPLASWSS